MSDIKYGRIYQFYVQLRPPCVWLCRVHLWPWQHRLHLVQRPGGQPVWWLLGRGTAQLWRWSVPQPFLHLSACTFCAWIWNMPISHNMKMNGEYFLFWLSPLEGCSISMVCTLKVRSHVLFVQATVPRWMWRPAVPWESTAGVCHSASPSSHLCVSVWPVWIMSSGARMDPCVYPVTGCAMASLTVMTHLMSWAVWVSGALNHSYMTPWITVLINTQKAIVKFTDNIYP